MSMPMTNAADGLAGGVEIDGATVHRQIEELAAISEVPAPVVTRVLFSEADLAARRYVRGLCQEAGLETRIDAAGNEFARWVGTEPTLPAVASGSHIDAIPNAGRFDGVVGVLGALAAIRDLRRAGFRPRRSAGTDRFHRRGADAFRPRLPGQPTPRRRDGTCRRQPTARPRRTHVRRLAAGAGCAGDLAGVRLGPGAYAAFVELHIEQGPLLERGGIDIGVVEKIAAPSALRVRLEGEGGHAGAVLMPDRHDALLAGAEIALAVERAATESGSPDTVGTTGIFRIAPGAINSVPAHAELEIDLRDTNLQTREAARAQIERAVADAASRRGVRFELETINADAPAICDPRLVDLVLDQASRLGLSTSRMISRAYHDTLFMARVCPVTMIFIPCHKGYSHRPDEYAAPGAITAGIATLAGTLAALASE